MELLLLMLVFSAFSMFCYAENLSAREDRQEDFDVVGFLYIHLLFTRNGSSKKRNTKKKIKNTQISKAKARKTNMHCRLFS